MKTRINYHYRISFKIVESFEFKKYNETVDETCYFNRIIPRLNNILDNLIANSHSRQEVIMTNNNENNACLCMLQFMIVKNKLILICNFRSQDKNLGRPYDTLMLQCIATQVMRKLSLKKYNILCNVSNYHERTLKNPTGY